MSNALLGTLQNGYVCQDFPDTVIRVQHNRENLNYIRTFGVDLDKTKQDTYPGKIGILSPIWSCTASSSFLVWYHV